MITDHCVTVAEAALILRLSPRTLYTKRWRLRHGLRAAKFGRSLRFQRSDIDQFLKCHRQAAGS